MFVITVIKVVCPVEYDQFAWGNRLHQLGLATLPLPMGSRLFCAEELLERISEALDPSTSLSLDIDNIHKFAGLLVDEQGKCMSTTTEAVKRWMKNMSGNL